MAKILIVVERFYPEDFLVNDLVAEWMRQGLDIEVLTQVPSYPFDRIYDGYKNRRLQTTHENLGAVLGGNTDGPIVTVHRVSTIFGYNRSVSRKVLNYLHFGWRTFWWALWNGRPYGRVFIYHTAALTMAMAAIPMRIVWRRHVTIWTQDLWPDAVWGFGFKPSKWKVALLNTFVRFIYANCSRITVSCRCYVERIKELTGRSAEWIPQWEPSEMAISEKKQNGNVIFMFAGNMGVPQDLPNVIEGFLKADLENSELWLVGGGVMAKPLQEQFGQAKGVRFCGRQPRADMPNWFAQADALIISLTDKYSLTLPGKFQSYIKTGKPLLGILNGETRKLIEENGIGFTADPDDIQTIAEAYRKMYSEVSKGKSSVYGNRAKQLSTTLFNREQLIKKLLVV